MSADVHEGQDGWLFLTGVLGTLYDRASPELPDARLTEWLKLIEARAARLEKMGIRYVHMVAPEKLTIYDNKLKEPVVDWRLSPASRLGEKVSRSPVAHVWADIVHPLRAVRDQRQLYAKTDSHWNVEGAFVAYKILCARLGLAPDLDLLARKHVDYHAVLDLAARIDPPIPEWFKMYDFSRNATRWYCNSTAQYLETVRGEPAFFGGSHVAFRNKSPSAPKKKILVFGDSFCSQRTDSLTGMLAETVSKVEFIWAADLDWCYIERARPDAVVYEIAERNMAYMPRDDFSLRALLWKRGLKAKWLQLKARRRNRLDASAAGRDI